MSTKINQNNISSSKNWEIILPVLSGTALGVGAVYSKLYMISCLPSSLFLAFFNFTNFQIPATSLMNTSTISTLYGACAGAIVTTISSNNHFDKVHKDIKQPSVLKAGVVAGIVTGMVYTISAVAMPLIYQNISVELSVIIVTSNLLASVFSGAAGASIGYFGANIAKVAGIFF